MNSLKKIARKVISHVSALINRLKNEPVLVRTVLVLIASTGFVEISDAQIDKLDSIILIVLVLLGSTSIRRSVTPLPKEQRKPILRRRSQGGDSK